VWGAVFLTPGMAIILAFVLLPIVMTAWISLHRWSMFTSLGQMHWVGLANYRSLWGDGVFHHALQNTVIYAGLSLVITVPLAFVLGLLLFFPDAWGAGLLRTLLFGAYMIPTVAVALVWSALYAPDYGPINQAFEAVGLPTQPWLSSPDMALLSLVIFNVWQMVGYFTVLVVAGLTQIPGELYEVARLDGAGALRQTRSITLPLLRRTLTFVTVICAINSVQVFDSIYVLTQGGPVDSTNVLSFHVYRTAFEFGLAGQASAMAFVLLLVLAAASGIVLWAGRERA
jgi:ABC-type sugar transport system permease subunit